MCSSPDEVLVSSLSVHVQYNDVPGSDEEMELGAVGSDVSIASEGIALLFHYNLSPPPAAENWGLYRCLKTPPS